MAYERRIVTTADASWQRIFPPAVTTTDATPTVLYQSFSALPAGRAIMFRAACLVFTSDLATVSGFYETQAIFARGDTGGIRLVDDDVQISRGEITPKSHAKMQWAADSLNNKYMLMVTGWTGLTLTWVATIQLFRNNG